MLIKIYVILNICLFDPKVSPITAIPRLSIPPLPSRKLLQQQNVHHPQQLNWKIGWMTFLMSDKNDTDNGKCLSQYILNIDLIVFIWFCLVFGLHSLAIKRENTVHGGQMCFRKRSRYYDTTSHLPHLDLGVHAQRFGNTPGRILNLTHSFQHFRRKVLGLDLLWALSF